MTIRGSVTAWWVRAGGNRSSTLTCSETLCWVCNVSWLRTLLVTAGTQDGSYYYHLYYWGRKFSPANKNNGYYGIKWYHQLNSHRPWRSSITMARTQRHSPGTCTKLPLRVTKTDKWTISWKPAMLTRCTEQKTPSKFPKVAYGKGHTAPPLRHVLLKKFV